MIAFSACNDPRHAWMANDLSFMTSVSPTAASATIVLTNLLFVGIASTRVPLLSSRHAFSKAVSIMLRVAVSKCLGILKRHDSLSCQELERIIIVPVMPMIVRHCISFADQKRIVVSHRTIRPVCSCSLRVERFEHPAILLHAPETIPAQNLAWDL